MRKQTETKPSSGWAEWSDSGGTYRGEWADGLQHGQGTFISNAGVRYDGEWRHGKQVGSGAWRFSAPVVQSRKQHFRKIPDRANFARLSCPRPVQYGVWLREAWPKMTAADRDAYASNAVLLWPSSSLWLENQISNDFLAEFFTRTLVLKSKVKVAACNQIPMLWSKIPEPELGMELWVLDTDRNDIGRKDDHSEPMVIMHLHFRHKFESASCSCSDLVAKYLQVSFGRGTSGRETLWDKCSTLDERGNKHLKTVTEIELPDRGFRFGDPQGILSLCQESPPCWQGSDPSSKYTKKDLEALGLCMQCLTLAAVHQICVDADEMKANALYKPGLALPISPDVDRALRKADGRAFIFGDPNLADVKDLQMGLDALRWSTSLFENSSKHGTESNILNVVHDNRFATGPMLFVLIGQLVSHAGRMYLAPKDVDFSACTAEDWELEVRAKCSSFAWMQAQVARVRGTRCQPTIFLFDGRCGSVTSDVPPQILPTSATVVNSLVLSYSQQDPTEDRHVLQKIRELIVQANVEVKDFLADMRVQFQHQLRIEHWGMTQEYIFVQDPPSSIIRYPEPRSLVDLAQIFMRPVVCGLPLAAVAGRVGFQARLARVGMDSKRVSAVEWLISRFEAMGWRGLCVLHGRSGSGKTAVAAEVLHQLTVRGRSFHLFWLRAADPHQLYFDVLFMAQSLGLVAAGERQMDVLLQRVRKWLALHTGWAVAIEDLGSFGELERLQLPLSKGMVLCTSPKGEWQQVHWEDIVELGPFRQLEAHAFVLLQLPDEQPALVEQLVTLLQCQQLPLALAVAYMLAESLSVKGYVELLLGAKKKEGHLHGPVDTTQDAVHGGVDQGTSLAVAITMEVLETLSAHALRLTQMCACLSPSAIPRALLTRRHDKDDLDLLVRFGLLEPEAGDTFSMHPLLQSAVRHFTVRSLARRVSADHKPSPLLPIAKACDSVLALLDTAAEGVPHNNTLRGRFLAGHESWLVHALATRQHGGRPGGWLLEASAEAVGLELQDYEQALHLLRLLREELTQDPSSSYARLASVMASTASVQMEREHWGEAGVLLEQALQLQEGLLRADAASAAELSAKCGHEEAQCELLAQELEKLRAAHAEQQIRRRRTAAATPADGAAERAVADKEGRLALARESLSRNSQARAERCLTLGLSRRAVASTLRALADCLQRSGDTSRPRALYNRALQLYRTPPTVFEWA